MKLRTEEPYLSPRLPVIAKLKPQETSPEIWPLWAVVMLAAAVIALSAFCGWLNDKAQRAAEVIVQRVEEAQERIDEHQAAAQAWSREDGAGSEDSLPRLGLYWEEIDHGRAAR